MSTSSRPALTRRAFLERAALSGGAVATAAALPAPLAALEALCSAPAAAPAVPATNAAVHSVVAYFNGQLWMAPGDTCTAYEPPIGARAAASIAEMSDEDVRRTRLYI